MSYSLSPFLFATKEAWHLSDYSDNSHEGAKSQESLSVTSRKTVTDQAIWHHCDHQIPVGDCGKLKSQCVHYI